MVRELIPMAWCDVDMAEDRQVPMVASHEVVLDGKAYTVDLCEVHEAEGYKPFADLVTRGSAPAPKVSQKAAQVVRQRSPRAPSGGRNGSDAATRECILCGVVLASRNIHDRHIVQAHNLPRATALYGLACPVCGERDFKSAQGLGSHGASSHGLYDSAAMFVAARAAGDPHGIVAELMERVVLLGGSVEPLAQVLTREEHDQRIDDEARVAADALRAAGLTRPGAKGRSTVVRTALGGGVSRTLAEDRIRRAVDLGLL